MAQLMPLPLTVSCFSKIQIGFTFLVPAHLGSPGKRAVKRACVCLCVSVLGGRPYVVSCRQCLCVWSVLGGRPSVVSCRQCVCVCVWSVLGGRPSVISCRQCIVGGRVDCNTASTATGNNSTIHCLLSDCRSAERV